MIQKIAKLVYLSRLEIIIAALSLGCISTAMLIRAINPINYQYAQLTSSWVMPACVLFLIVMLFFAGYLKSFMPFRGRLLMTVLLVSLPFVSGFAGEGPVLLTPFHTIDAWLLHVDKLMGFSTNAIMNSAHKYPWFVSTLNYAYGSLFPLQMITVPILLTLFGHYDTMKRLAFAMTLGSIIAGIIYFLWPTTGPASVVHNQYFAQSSHELVARFKAIHNNLLPPSSKGMGLIAFPSCHVFYACVLTIMMRPIKFIFIPMILLNTLLIIATMALGYHYLADVIAGIILALGTLKISKLKILNPQQG